jgi:hypothetical protein
MEIRKERERKYKKWLIKQENKDVRANKQREEKVLSNYLQ